MKSCGCPEPTIVTFQPYYCYKENFIGMLHKLLQHDGANVVLFHLYYNVQHLVYVSTPIKTPIPDGCFK